jgi:hypothetical protein
MHSHGGDEAGVMHLHALHIVLHHQPFPFRLHGRGFWQKRQRPLDFADFGQRERDGKSQPIMSCRAGGHVPELGDSLKRKIDGFTGSQEAGYALDRHGMAGVVGLRSS